MLSLPHGRILLTIGWILVVMTVYVSLVARGPSMGGLFHVSDKVQHAFAYFVLMVWFAGLYPRRQHWILGVGLFLLGGLLEVLQGTMTTTREMELRDLAANTSGILIGYGLAGFGLANWALRLESWWTRKLRK
jgi:VanZ family protein